MMRRTPASSFLRCIESLEARQLLAWGPFPQLVEQNAAVSAFPGITGAGQTIAILDTGVNYNIPELGGGFGPGHKVIDGYNFVNNNTNVMDTDGHGTGVATLAAGGSYTYGGATYQGIAPGANIVALRVDDGSGIIPDSRYQAALQWVIDHRAQYNIVSVNISEGGNNTFTAKTTNNSIYAPQLATLKAAGVFIAVASGNDGVTNPPGIEYPAADPSVYSVGSINSGDGISTFTDRSAILDILAPGENVPAAYLNTSGQEVHIPASGTSFATPYIAGAAALLRQANSSLTPDQIMADLKAGASLNYDSATGLSYARLDLYDAIALASAQARGAPPAPYGGTPASATGIVQGENFDTGGEGVGYHDLTFSNLGGAYRTTEGVDIEKTTDAGGGYDVGFITAGEWLNYTVNVAADGTYSFNARVASAGTGGSFHVEVDGSPVSSALTVPNTGAWQTYTTISTGGISLTAGTHNVRLVFDRKGATGFVGNLNWFQFTSSSSATSTPFTGTPSGVPGTIQIENYDNGGEGVAYHDTEAQNLGGQYRSDGVDIGAATDAGGGYYVGWTKAGEWMNYSINVASSTAYTLSARVASAGQGGTFHVLVDGVSVGGTMTVPNTNGWQTWTTISQSGLNLTAGTHILRLVLDTNGATGYVGNMNWLRLDSGTPTSTPYFGTPSALPGQVQAENYDLGGQGIAYNDLSTYNQGGAYRTSEAVGIEATTDTGGGYDVAYIQAGEWLNYTTNVSTTGTYTFSARVASAGKGGTFHVEVDGVNVTGALSVPSTNGWQRWTTISKTSVSLTAGTHVVRLVFDTNGSSGFVGNLNWWQFA